VKRKQCHSDSSINVKEFRNNLLYTILLYHSFIILCITLTMMHLYKLFDTLIIWFIYIINTFFIDFLMWILIMIDNALTLMIIYYTVNHTARFYLLSIFNSFLKFSRTIIIYKYNRSPSNVSTFNILTCKFKKNCIFNNALFGVYYSREQEANSIKIIYLLNFGRQLY